MTYYHQLQVNSTLIFSLFLGVLISGCALTTDIEIAKGSPSHQKILTSASEIRKLIENGKLNLNQDQKNIKAKTLFEDGLSAWKLSSQFQMMGTSVFEGVPAKLFDSYVSYLMESNQPSLVIDVLRIAISEADKDREYQFSSSFRSKLAEVLTSVGQTESAQNILHEEQALSDRVYGALTDNMSNLDPFQLAENASIISSTIQNGGMIDKRKLSTFAEIYKKAEEVSPAIRFITPMTPGLSIAIFGHKMNDDNYYRRDQEYWRWIAIGAIRVGDFTLARTSVERMLSSSDAAGNNKYANDSEWKGDYAWQAKAYMHSYYISPQNLKHQKFSDTAFALETVFDSSLAGAEIYLMLDDVTRADQLTERANNILVNIDLFSRELQKLGHIGLHAEERRGELQRVSAKVDIKNKKWEDALEQLDQYVAWSEKYRNSLSLQERLPYFRGKSQGAYFDTLFARASLFLAQPQEANFYIALDALGNMKSRHLMDSLGASGKINNDKVTSKETIDKIVNSGQGFLSVADTGTDLIIFFADKNEKKIRIIKKSKDFDQGVLSIRNTLAEQQVFDAARTRVITSLILGELETKVFEKEKLVVELDGVLSFLPVEVWMNSKMNPMGKKTIVSYIPTLAITNVNHIMNTSKGILAFGDAQFNKTQQLNAIGATKEDKLRGKREGIGFTPLPETRDEVNSIVKNVQEGGKVVLGKNATKSEFFRQIDSAHYKYLHFATHGVVGGEIPHLNEPALVLTPENNDAGFLTATEISKMKIDADLVVLSACNSGNGEYFSGEGLMGLGRAFILAGAKAVVVSLWPVDSYTTKEMMIKFYSDLQLTGNPSLSLANARKSVMRGNVQNSNEVRALKRVKTESNNEVANTTGFVGRKNPFFWAPFILIESGL